MNNNHILRTLRKHRLTIGTLAVIIGLVLVLNLINSPRIAGAASSERQLPIYSVSREDKTIAISFDAAWGNEDTQTLIDILEKYNIKTTFFVVGDWARKYPESVKALYDAGHEIMSHSDHHDHYNSLTTQQIVSDVKASCKAISDITGVEPTLIRCPYGEYDNHVIEAIRSIGIEPIQWDVDSLDWKDLSASEITQRVTKGVKPGSIVLFHNAAKNTPEALPQLLEKLIADGYSIIPISQILLDGEYQIDHTGKMQPKGNV